MFLIKIIGIYMFTLYGIHQFKEDVGQTLYSLSLYQFKFIVSKIFTFVFLYSIKVVGYNKRRNLKTEAHKRPPRTISTYIEQLQQKAVVHSNPVLTESMKKTWEIFLP